MEATDFYKADVAFAAEQVVWILIELLSGEEKKKAYEAFNAISEIHRYYAEKVLCD